MLRRSALLLVVLSAVAIVVTAYAAHDYLSHRARLQDEAFAAAQSQAVAAAQSISIAFGDVMAIAEGLVGELADGTLAYTDIERRMFDLVGERPDLDGVAITFEPYAYAPDERLFQTYVYQEPDGSFASLVGATYDYTQEPDAAAGIFTAWYVDTIKQGAQWHEPFFATGAQKILVEYGIPFPHVDAEPGAPPAGIISIDYTLQDVSDLIRALELGETGYGFVISGQGTFLAHPVREFVVNRTIFDITGGDQALNTAAQEALDGAGRFVETRDPITGETTWYFFEPIGSTGWAVGIVLNIAQFLPDEAQTVRDQMNILLAGAAAIFLVSTTIFHLDRYRFTNFWAVTLVFTVLCVILIGLAWALTGQLEDDEGVLITSQSQLDRYLQGVEPPAGSNGAAGTAVMQIPTGLLVQALDFPDPTSVTVNGLVWQRYPLESNVTRGFSLPQRIGEEATIEEVRREVVDDAEVILWAIGVTLRQTYDTSRFPFDQRTIVVRLAPADMTSPVLLTPDLDGYEILTPRALPGVDSQAGINNWTLLNSHFSYTEPPRRVDFGMREAAGALPELRFSIQAQRITLGSFIAYLLPGLVAAALTFAYLISGHEPGKREEIPTALSYAAALFFVVAVIHNALRDQIAAVGITYMEHFYLLLYVAIIAVAADVFLVARRPNWFIVRYQNNLIPKVLYWSLFAGMMLISTLATFVY